MTYVDTDQHSALFVKCGWELEVIKIATSFTIHLSQNIGSF
jgi:hypothetical protein